MRNFQVNPRSKILNSILLIYPRHFQDNPVKYPGIKVASLIFGPGYRSVIETKSMGIATGLRMTAEKKWIN